MKNDVIIVPEHRSLNLGCGNKKFDGFWNVDIEPKCNPDQFLDMEKTPWPYEDNFFDEISAVNILEHVGQDPKIFTNIIKEMYRVSKNQAKWFVEVPHHRSDLHWDDYTHVRPLTPKTFMMFDQKVNYESIAKKLSDSTFGLYHNVDIEVVKATYNLVDYWMKLKDDGMVGEKEFWLKMNTLSNTIESVHLWILVHKPCRFEEWYRTFGQ
jgi:hypothetical protein